MNEEEYNLDDFLVLSQANSSLENALKALQEHDEIISKTKTKSENVALFRQLLSSNHQESNLFRKSDGAPEAQILLWISRVKDAATLYSAVSDIPNFEGLSTEHMRAVSKLSQDPNNLREIAEHLRRLGIIIIYEPQTKGMKLDGVVFKLVSGTPVIAMTLRYPRLDYFWFTLMHELSHIHLHLDRLGTPIVENLDEESKDIVELEANRLAKDIFVPKHIWRNCPARLDLKDKLVIDFSRQQEIHPSIVAGMLRHELNRYDLFSKIVNGINVREIIFGHE